MNPNEAEMDAQANEALGILLTHAGNIQALASLWFDSRHGESNSWWVCLSSLADDNLHTHWSGGSPQAVVEEAIEDTRAWPRIKRSFWEINQCLIDCVEYDESDENNKQLTKRKPLEKCLDPIMIGHMYAAMYQN